MLVACPTRGSQGLELWTIVDDCAQVEIVEEAVARTVANAEFPTTGEHPVFCTGADGNEWLWLRSSSAPTDRGWRRGPELCSGEYRLDVAAPFSSGESRSAARALAEELDPAIC